MELDETGSRRFFRIRPFSRRPWKTERMKISPSPPPSTPLRLTEGRALVLAGIVLSALNLRTAVTSITPLLDEPCRVFGCGGTTADFLGMLPSAALAVSRVPHAALAPRTGTQPTPAPTLA